jgi:hypothetical protein
MEREPWVFAPVVRERARVLVLALGRTTMSLFVCVRECKMSYVSLCL